MAATKERPWKILVIGRGQAIAEKAEKHLHELGFKHAKVISIEDDKGSDEKLIQMLTDHEWDAVSIGGGINGFNENSLKEVSLLHWFNRLVNIIHERAPKAKFIFVATPNDLADSFERVLG